MPLPANHSNDSNRIPVSVVTGFLGSGKTTLLNHLVRHPGMADTALIVNEFGEIGIDHELVDSSYENTVVMDSGCICCSIRGDLIDTIGDLFANVAHGRLPAFSRILIETTGLADPTPIAHTLRGEPVVADRCRLDSIIVTVDAQNAEQQFDAHEEALRQVAIADVALITKLDLVSEEMAERVSRRLSQLNPGLPIKTVLHGSIDPALLFAASTASIEHIATGDFRQTGDAEQAHEAQSEPHEHGAGHAHHHDTDVNRHGDIRAYTIQTAAPLCWNRLRLWLESVYSLRGHDFLRLKGIVQITEENRPVVIQGVGNTFSPPSFLAEWPGRERVSRIVLITRGLSDKDIQKSFDAFVLNDIADIHKLN